jgi:alpha-ribazole phosphatase
VSAAAEAQGVVPDQVWSSPSSRCVAPATLVAQRLGLPLRMDDRLNELGFGEWEGRSWKEIEASDAATLQAWMLAWETMAPPGGETVGELVRRVREWYWSVEAERCHLLVGHAGVIRALRVISGQDDWHGAMGREVASLVPERFVVQRSR